MTAQANPPPTVTSILRIEMAVHPDAVEVQLIGEMDISTRGELATAISGSHLNGATQVRLDLSSLDFCDASGVAELVAAHDAVTRRNRVLATHGVPPHVLRVLRLTGTTHILGAEGGD